MRRFVALLAVALLIALAPTTAGFAASVAPPPGVVAPAPPMQAATTAAMPSPTPTPMPVTTPEAGANLVRQAATLLLNRDVVPLRSDTLYLAAYMGTLDALRKAGVAPDAPPMPLFSGDTMADTTNFRVAYLAAVPAGGMVDQAQIAYAAIRAMTDSVHDCHTTFKDPEAYRRVIEPTFVGIGAYVPDARPLLIAEVLKDTPAERAGLRPGDRLLGVDGVDVATISRETVSDLIRGKDGTTVALRIQRPGEEMPRTVMVVRGRVPNQGVTATRIIAMPDGGKIGYIKLFSFANSMNATVREGIERDMLAALEGFEREGVTAWVLDLRNNGGGSTAVLQHVAGFFLANGSTLAYDVNRAGREMALTVDAQTMFAAHYPLAILVNRNSGSSAEILSFAAQESGAARLFGEQTEGCIGAFSTARLTDGSALDITTITTTTPSHRALHRVGVTPDEIVPEDDTYRTDPVLDAAVRWLAGMR